METKRKFSKKKYPSFGWRNKHPSEKTKKKISKAMKGRSNFWLKGKHISEEHKRKLSKANKGSNNPNFENHEPIKKLWEKGVYDKKILNHNVKYHTFAKGGYYKGIWMRSSWEIKYAKYLDENNIKWKYGKKFFLLSNGSRYIPDFYLTETDEWIEIKGWMDKRSKLKIKLFRKEYSNLKFKVIGEKKWKTFMKNN